MKLSRVSGFCLIALLTAGSLTVIEQFLQFPGGPTPAAAAGGSITIDEPDADGKMVADENQRVWFRGTISPPDGGSIYLFVDGRLVTCDDYLGNDLDTPSGVNGCWRIAGVEGSTWDFPLSSDELERLGLTFFGVHDFRFVLISTGSSRSAIEAEARTTVELVAALPTQSPSPEPPVSEDLGDEGLILPPPAAGLFSQEPSSSRLWSGNPSSPSVLSTMKTFTELNVSPGSLIATAVVTIILLLLVGLPSALLGQTLSENYDRIFGKVSKAFRGASKALSAPALPKWIPLTFGLAIATILSAFVDPAFGWNLGSLRMLASMGAAFVIEGVLGWIVIRAVLRKTNPGLNPVPEFKFGSLVVILIAVVLSRVVGFEPGMVFGLVVGLAFGATLAAATEVRVKLIGLGWALAVGLVCWVGYSLLAGLTGFVPIFMAETLSAVTVGALAALPVVLLPLRGLDGGVLFGWNKWVWAGIYFLALALFFFLLMPMPFSWGEVQTPLVTWVIMYLGYGLLAAGVWAWFRFSKPKQEAAADAAAATRTAKTPAATTAAAAKGKTSTNRVSAKDR